MKIAISGVTGFLGQYVQKELEKYGHEIIGLSRNGKNSTNYTVESLDLFFKDVDAIIHLAAQRGSGRSISEYLENITLTQNIFEAARNNNIKNIVYASTISVYKGGKHIYTETDKAEPMTMYGISKYMGELLGNYYNEKHNMYIKSLRLAHIFGFNEKNNYMINLFMRKAFNHETLEVLCQSKAKREMIYAKDAAAGIRKAVEAKEISGTFNIGGQAALTNLEIAKIINRVMKNNNLKVGIEKESIISSYMSSRKADIKLKYQPQYSFEQAIEEIYKEMQKLKTVPIYIQR